MCFIFIRLMLREVLKVTNPAADAVVNSRCECNDSRRKKQLSSNSCRKFKPMSRRYCK